VKTKKVDGCDLPASAFAFVGDPEDTSTWKLPIYFPGDPVKTRNHVKDALGRLSGTKGMPTEQRESVKLILVGAAKVLGIEVQHSFRSMPAEPTAAPAVPGTARPLAPEPTAPAPTGGARPLLSETELKELEAIADYRAASFLKALGLE
jgi:hypothetical protein